MTTRGQPPGSWVAHSAALERSATPFVVVTVAEAAGHAPREAGAKMLVTATDVWGTVGGGSLEHTAVLDARAMLAAGDRAPVLRSVDLRPGAGEHGVQCCGGRVTLLLEPVEVRRPVVAVFGAGHVGWALVDVLRRLPVAVVLVDSRAERLALHPTTAADQVASVEARHARVPETAVADLPGGSHLVVLTHDHAEDLAIVDTALRRDDLGYLGLIGSGPKWAHFRRRLAAEGHDEAALARVTTPIGVPGVPGRSPAAIAIATAAQLLGHLPPSTG